MEKTHLNNEKNHLHNDETKVAFNNPNEPPACTHEHEERDTWSGRFDFLLSCVGYAVGLGNIWRFPYLCMRNGGGAFLIPYFTFLMLCGMPLFFLELSLGQFSSLSPLSVWRITPLFKGLGWGMVVVSVIISIYYNIIIAWVLYYLGMSMTSQLPWSQCDNEWNTPTCRDRFSRNTTVYNETEEIRSHFEYLQNRTLAQENSSVLENGSSVVVAASAVKGLTATEEFWQYKILELTDGFHNLGGIKWEILVCLIAAWVIVFLCVIKGVRSSGKVVYVTATAPYIFLIILLIRGATLPGALEGIKFYIIPKWHKLGKIQVWAEACLQIFYSLGPAWGGLLTMASYNKFKHNCYRDAIIVPCITCGTSFFGGFVIFSVIGHMAHMAGQSVDDVITQGPGLAFIAYPEALSRLPIAPAWAILFFLMLLTVGLDSQFGTFETVVSGLVDAYPRQLQKKKTLVCVTSAGFLFLLGLPLTTRGGMYIFQLLDWYCAAFSVFIIGCLESIIIGWIYGVKRFYKDIEMMLGFQPSVWWKICWCFITPGLILAMLFYSIVNLSPPKYGDYEFPPLAIACGLIVAVVSVLPIPICMVHQLLQEKGSLLERVKSSLQPKCNWGPALEKYRAQYNNSVSYVEMNGITKHQNGHHVHLTEQQEPLYTPQANSKC